MPHDCLHVDLREEAQGGYGEVAEVAQPGEDAAGAVEEDEAQQHGGQAVRVQHLPGPGDDPERGRLQSGHLEVARLFHHHLGEMIIEGYEATWYGVAHESKDRKRSSVSILQSHREIAVIAVSFLHSISKVLTFEGRGSCIAIANPGELGL